MDIDLDPGGTDALLLEVGLLLSVLNEEPHVSINSMLQLNLLHRHKLLALDSEVLFLLVEQLVVLTMSQMNIIVLLPSEVVKILGSLRLRAFNEILLKVGFCWEHLPWILLLDQAACILSDVVHQTSLLQVAYLLLLLLLVNFDGLFEDKLEVNLSEMIRLDDRVALGSY